MGFVYALIAAGLSLIFGLMEIVNFAHGEFLMGAMFATFWAWALLKLDPLVSLPFTVLLLALFGLLVYHGLIRWILGAPMLAQIFATFGLAIFLRAAAQALWGADFRLVKGPLVDGRPSCVCRGCPRRLRQCPRHPPGRRHRGHRRGAGRAPDRARPQVRRGVLALPRGSALAPPGPPGTLLMPPVARWPVVRWTGAGTLLLLLLAFPLVFTQPHPRHVVITIFLFAMLAQAWNLLAGYCGQISLGHAVFFGAGAYTSTLLGKYFDLSPWIGMVVGAVVAVALSQLIGYPGFRLRGHYFAIATIAVGEIVNTLMINWDWAGGARGLFVPIKRPDSFVNLQFHQSKQNYYYIALGLLLLALWITRKVEVSRMGYYLRAIREDQDAAASLGIPVAAYKQRAMALSAALTALGGSFYAQYILFIDPDSVFPTALSILICLVAVLGGIGTLWGPLIGAAILIPLGEWTRIYFGGTGKAIDLLIDGALILLVSVIQPGGILAPPQRGRRRTG